VTAATAGMTGRDAGNESGLITASQSLGGALGLVVLVTVATKSTAATEGSAYSGTSAGDLSTAG
jgi:hypothetical protein